MGFDLAVDFLEPKLSFGYLFAEVGGQLGEEVAAFEFGGGGVEVELGDFAGEEGGSLAFEGDDVAEGVFDLAADAEVLGGEAFLGDGGNLLVVVEDALEGVDVAAGVGIVGAGHESGEVGLFGGVTGEVGVDALGDVAEEGLEGGWWIELGSLVGFAKGGFVGFGGALTGFCGALAGGFGVVEVYFTFGDAGFEVVEIGVEDADLAEVTAFEGFELGAEVSELELALGEGDAEAGELFALDEELGLFGCSFEGDLGWHGGFRRRF